MKVVPFTEGPDGRWTGRLSRYDVTIIPKEGQTYWRGPENEVVLETDQTTYGISIRGKYSSIAYTLEGAMARAETEARRLDDSASLEAKHYALTPEQAQAEADAYEQHQRDTIEADRIAHANGWGMSLDVNPDLKAFAEENSLYPFPEPVPVRAVSGPTP